MSASLKFVLMVGFMSFFADFTYEGSRSIIGQYLPLLGAGPLAISIITGFGEFLGYALRLVSGRSADRTGLYWPIIISGYILQMTVVPLLALAQTWQVAGILIVLERVGKATRNPPRDAMLSHAAKQMGYGWAFGVHEALDQFGALFGPLFVALLLKIKHGNYQFAFAMLAAPGGVMLLGLAVARFLYPRPQDLESESPSQDTDKLPRAFWIYLIASALVAAGFADFPIIAYNFHRTDFSDELIPILYSVAMAVSGAGSLLFGRLLDRFGLGLLIPLTLIAAIYAPLVFLGRGLIPSVIGSCLWGLGMGVHESIIPAAVAPMVGPGRRASAYGLFTSVYGISWFIGSAIIGVLFNRWMPAVVIFSVGLQLAAIPLIFYARRLIINSEPASMEPDGE
ncbi:hypothetical protein VE02_10343 [Pseudogymnoascus sp. 03VT05]|nr:hypothetical protein VE02_10343 [Pseudogymnoascus sp. 03VT05]